MSTCQFNNYQIGDLNSLLEPLDGSRESVQGVSKTVEPDSAGQGVQVLVPV